MFSQEEYDELYPLACDWAQQQEATVLALGRKLSEKQAAIGQGVGIRDTERVRVLAVPEIPTPEDEKLGAATAKTNMITRACRGIAIGYGVILRADSWSDEELLAHQLVHVAQYERAGGVAPFLDRYFRERLEGTGFSIGALEGEARSVAATLVAAPE